MTHSWPDYELLDFGDGRKLERFGQWVLDRPCPGAITKPQAWGDADAKFQGERADEGQWVPPPKEWLESECVIEAGSPLDFQMQLSPLPSGQVGVFPEQFANWLWILERVQRAKRPLRVLNLFAYTGGSTLAAARGGAEVTHVDAAKSMVNRARRNAEASGLLEHPIRWFVDDATKFCLRELNRSKQYDAVILDPPSYGHGPKGEPWSIQRDLLQLLELCGKLTTERREFVLCSCHTPSIGPAELSAYLSDGLFGHCGQPPRVGTLYLESSDGRKISSGVFARWPG